MPTFLTITAITLGVVAVLAIIFREKIGEAWEWFSYTAGW